MSSLIVDVAAVLKKLGDQMLLPAFERKKMKIEQKADQSLVTDLDRRCQQHLQKALASIDASIGFLGEEMTEPEQLRLLAKGGRLWCVDPLDGTGNFVAGFPCFAITVALLDEGQALLSWIYDPVRQEMFIAHRGRGVYLNGRAVSVLSPKELSMATGFIDFKRLPGRFAALLACSSAYRSQRNVGSCALEWAWLASGRAHFLLHGGECLWDLAPGLLMLQEAGGVVTDLSSKRIVLAKGLRSSVLAASDFSLHQSLRAVLVGISRRLDSSL